ncbi:MAG TPA: SMC-Scp complex subunit ScpB [Pseudomonadales bacterium]
MSLKNSENLEENLGKTQLKNIVEGALLVANRTLGVDHLQALFDLDQRPEKDQIRAVLEELEEDYQGRAAELVKVSSGYRFQVRQDYAQWIGRLWEEKPPRYSRALLETLSLIAYKQPITRGEIESIRGVAVSSTIIKTLIERAWVKVVGHKDVPGRPAMYASTKEFLDYFGLKSLENLPPLADVRDLDKINQELPFEVMQELDATINADSMPKDADVNEASGAGNVVQISLNKEAQNSASQSSEVEQAASAEDGDLDERSPDGDTANEKIADEVGTGFSEDIDNTENTETDTQQQD